MFDYRNHSETLQHYSMKIIT